MARETGSVAGNYEKVVLGVSNDSSLEPRMLRVDPITNRLLVDAGSITVDPSGLATESKQDDIISAIENITVPAPTGGATEAKQDTLIGHVDGIETLIGTTNSSLSTIDSRVDGIEGLLTTIDADTSALAGAVSGSKVQTDVLTLPAVHFQDVYVTGQGSQTTLNNNVILATAGTGSYDTLNGTTGISFRSVSLTIVPAAGTVTAGVISFEGSNDNTNFVTVFLSDSANVTAEPVSSVTLAASTNRHFVGAIPFRYFRARISTGITGTTTGVQCFSVFNTIPYSSPRLTVSNATAASFLSQVSVASGGIASGAIASGAIAAGAIAAGATAIAANEDDASAAGDRLLKVSQIRLDTPVANANVSASGDYTQFIADNYGKTWVAGSVTEDVAHAAGESLMGAGVRRMDTAATSAGSSGDWATLDASAEGALWSTLTPTTTSGLSVANFTSGDTYTALTNTAQVIKASAGNLYGYYFFNPNSSTAYVMIYNIAAGSVTVGTSTAQCVFAIPAGSAANLMMPYPITFSNAGWSIAAATTGGGNTAPSTALECMIWYK